MPIDDLTPHALLEVRESSDIAAGRSRPRMNPLDGADKAKQDACDRVFPSAAADRVPGREPWPPGEVPGLFLSRALQQQLDASYAGSCSCTHKKCGDRLRSDVPFIDMR